MNNYLVQSEKSDPVFPIQNKIDNWKDYVVSFSSQRGKDICS